MDKNPSQMTLWEQWKEHSDPEAKKELIEAHIPLVQFVVNRVAIGLPKNIQFDDLQSYGVLGLIDAMEKFEYKRGLKFETYASWRIRGAILDHLRKGDWVPRSIREKSKKLEEAYKTLEQKHLRSVTDQEVCEFLNISESELYKMLQEVSVTTIYSLDEPVQEEESETRKSLLIDKNAILPESKISELHLKETLANAIEKLTNKERMVVSLYYYEDLSLSEIAEVMSLTPSRISQLHSKAILRLRGALSL
ncbi:FliA/WhiG family RNA polymerase sigma factor [Chengkuizengella axinellae]|uniref:FliA/WhiG family RNA polymerase sigma factor n=1 Tax=Chengkuizengella axinellae TaxID=3064388 RepID=A0ABT9IVT4_9BACL|nr:FliA/WhiG family RNA polymerase sigma factor [Chengkuizengella sp. 2205SS18-9]MDP5273466.1 FliA/WhiG family RNA polymerase sigma factor [Chengkuizengella sp. 2205SS18-9]